MTKTPKAQNGPLKALGVNYFIKKIMLTQMKQVLLQMILGSHLHL